MQRQGDLKSTLRSYEKQYILQILQDNEFDKHVTARTLNVGLSSLYRKMDQLGIPRQPGRYEPLERPSASQKRPKSLADGAASKANVDSHS